MQCNARQETLVQSTYVSRYHEYAYNRNVHACKPCYLLLAYERCKACKALQSSCALCPKHHTLTGSKCTWMQPRGTTRAMIYSSGPPPILSNRSGFLRCPGREAFSSPSALSFLPQIEQFSKLKFCTHTTRQIMYPNCCSLAIKPNVVMLTDSIFRGIMPNCSWMLHVLGICRLRNWKWTERKKKCFQLL